MSFTPRSRDVVSWLMRPVVGSWSRPRPRRPRWPVVLGCLAGTRRLSTTAIEVTNDAGRTRAVGLGRDRDHGLVPVWSGGVLAQDTATPFRPACDLLTTDAVSAVLGVDVTPEDGDAVRLVLVRQ